MRRRRRPRRQPHPKRPCFPRILKSLDDDKAEEIATINLAGRASFCDAIVIANGRSSRHVASIAEHLARRLKEAGYGTRPVDGARQGDWVLVDAGDVVVHIFRPESTHLLRPRRHVVGSRADPHCPRDALVRAASHSRRRPGARHLGRRAGRRIHRTLRAYGPQARHRRGRRRGSACLQGARNAQAHARRGRAPSLGRACPPARR